MSLALIRSGKLTCTYCGDTATTADHVPAVIYKYYVTVEHRYCVPSCRECNLVLGRKKLFDVLDRRIWVQNYYRKKYRRILKLPDLPIDEMGYALRTMVQSGKNAQAWINNRITFTPSSVHEMRFPYYQDGRLSQDRASFFEHDVHALFKRAYDFEIEIESLLKNDQWVNS